MRYAGRSFSNPVAAQAQRRRNRKRLPTGSTMYGDARSRRLPSRSPAFTLPPRSRSTPPEPRIPQDYTQHGYMSGLDNGSFVPLPTMNEGPERAIKRQERELADLSRGIE